MIKDGEKGITMEPKVVISFNPIEAIQIERVVLDRDKDEALKIIEKIILKKIREASPPH